MSDVEKAPEKPTTDVTALSGSVLAVVISLFVSPGPYGVISLLVSLTFISIILTYVWAAKRRWPQSLAFAAVIGLVSIPGIGYFAEGARSPSSLKYFLGTYEWKCGKDLCMGDKFQSRTRDAEHQYGWLAVTVIMFIADLAVQRRRREANGER